MKLPPEVAQLITLTILVYIPSIQNQVHLRQSTFCALASLAARKYLAIITKSEFPQVHLTVMFSFSQNTLLYDNRKNPYSEELLHQFKIDLFDEFLFYIQATYSGEV